MAVSTNDTAHLPKPSADCQAPTPALNPSMIHIFPWQPHISVRNLSQFISIKRFPLGLTHPGYPCATAAATLVCLYLIMVDHNAMRPSFHNAASTEMGRLPLRRRFAYAARVHISLR